MNDRFASIYEAVVKGKLHEQDDTPGGPEGKDTDGLRWLGSSKDDEKLYLQNAAQASGETGEEGGPQDGQEWKVVDAEGNDVLNGQELEVPEVEGMSAEMCFVLAVIKKLDLETISFSLLDKLGFFKEREEEPDPNADPNKPPQTEPVGSTTDDGTGRATDHGMERRKITGGYKKPQPLEGKVPDFSKDDWPTIMKKLLEARKKIKMARKTKKMVTSDMIKDAIRLGAAAKKLREEAGRKLGKQTAAEAYKFAQSEIQRELTTLNGALDIHEDGFDGDQQNWGHVGDLTHVLELLEQINDFLGAPTEFRTDPDLGGPVKPDPNMGQPNPNGSAGV